MANTLSESPEKMTCKGNGAVRNRSVVIVLHRAVDVGFYDRRPALHDLAGIHAALPGIRCAPVHPRAPGREFNQFTQQSSKPQHSYFKFAVSQNGTGQRLLGTTCCTPGLITRFLTAYASYGQLLQMLLQCWFDI